MTDVLNIKLERINVYPMCTHNHCTCDSIKRQWLAHCYCICHVSFLVAYIGKSEHFQSFEQLYDYLLPQHIDHFRDFCYSIVKFTTKK